MPGSPTCSGAFARCTSLNTTMLFTRKNTALVTPEDALSGRDTPMRVPERHAVLGTPMKGPFPDGVEVAIFGMGCFWGAEKIFWEATGVYTTAVGYAGGFTPNPTYEEVCSGRTGHTEAVLVAFDRNAGATYDQMLKLFWEGHDPTQGMRQGNDVGTQYRSMILWRDDAQRQVAEASRDVYQEMLTKAGHGHITTELVKAGEFYYAEDYHQQYLAKNPGGYCGLGGTGVSCPVGLATEAAS
jgi:peptide-methionine (S)-S-oxide reductase